MSKLLIATPFYNSAGFAPYIASLVETTKLLTVAGVEWEYWQLTGDAYVDRARNTLCARFLKTGATDLLFIDSDMSWNLEGFNYLLKSPHEITGGAYPAKNSWEEWTANAIITLPDRKPLTDNEGRIRAVSLPMGFTRIKRSAFEKMEAAYPNNWYWSDISKTMPEREKTHNFFECPVIDNRRHGEDIGFCRKWIAMGEYLWIEPRIKFGHFGGQEWKGCYNDAVDELCKISTIGAP
jgi:hypothetical protein